MAGIEHVTSLFTLFLQVISGANAPFELEQNWNY